MKLIVGLGNVGVEYTKTRHNVGFMAVDWLAYDWGEHWAEKRELEAYVARSVKQNAVLAKPSAMMNSSGRSVAKLLNYYKLMPADLIVIHDDADLELGDVRVAEDTQTGAGHHGVLSVIESVGSGFKRIRLGVGRPDQPVRDISNYVLQKLNENEIDILKKVLPKLSGYIS